LHLVVEGALGPLVPMPGVVKSLDLRLGLMPVRRPAFELNGGSR
jgi:hypothetical protein